MIPKILGIGATILATGFILALPSVFEGEPASEVEPIRFGPPPLQELAAARRVEEPPPNPPNLEAPQSTPITALAPLPPVQVTATGGKAPGEGRGAGLVQTTGKGGDDDEAGNDDAGGRSDEEDDGDEEDETGDGEEDEDEEDEDGEDEEDD